MKVKGKRGSLTHSSGFVVSLQRLQAAVKAEKQRCEKGGEHNLKRPLFATNTGKFLGSKWDWGGGPWALSGPWVTARGCLWKEEKHNPRCVICVRSRPRVAELWNTVGTAVESAAQRKRSQEPINEKLTPDNWLILWFMVIYIRWVTSCESNHLRQWKPLLTMSRPAQLGIQRGTQAPECHY